MEDNVIKKKSFDFSVRIVKGYKYLTTKKREFVLSKQLLRSGTSIGANIEEAIGGQSRKDFISKFSIAYKEARESKYWIRLLREVNYLTEEQAESLLDDCDEICKIISSILISSKNKDN
ncbi:four helix bundle protein [Candidatus Parcubacteria bacterium]|nr:MAG: four helix bundle protein [Candidatus Parcubacteria bacterium]